MDQLTDKQENLLNQFSQAVSDIKSSWRDKQDLLRWLTARHWDLNKAETMLRKHVQWRKENNIDTLLEDFTIPEVVSKYFPGGVCGEDKLGNPVYIDPIGRIDLKGLCYSVKKDVIVRCRVRVVEDLYQNVLQAQSQKHGKRITQCTHILDFEHFGKHHLWLPGGELFIGIIGALEANYPDTLHRSYVINAPAAFKLAFRFIKPFMSEDTLRRVVFLGEDWKERLGQSIEPDQLPVLYGGTKTDIDGDESCRSQVCYGGKIPLSYYRKKEELIPEGKSFEEITIRRRAHLLLEFHVTKADSALRWVFTTLKRDISFGVYFKEEMGIVPLSMMEVIQPPTRVNCHMVPEDGLIHCSKIGTYVIRFDNSYSIVRSKKLSYFVELISSEQTESPHKASALTPTRQEHEEITDNAVHDVALD